MNNLLDLLIKLAPIAGTFAPGVGAIPEVAVAVAALVKYIHEQNGMTTDEILQRADDTLDETERMLLADKLALG